MKENMAAKRSHMTNIVEHMTLSEAIQVWNATGDQRVIRRMRWIETEWEEETKSGILRVNDAIKMFFCNLTNYVTNNFKSTNTHFVIADSGCTANYVSPNIPHYNKQTCHHKILVHLPNGNTMSSSHTATLKLKKLPKEVTKAHIFPEIPNFTLYQSSVLVVFTTSGKMELATELKSPPATFKSKIWKHFGFRTIDKDAL